MSARKDVFRYYAFQSSPIPKDGRYCLAEEVQQRVWCFNPRPSRRMGATDTVSTQSTQHPKVSILAHPEGWALRLYKFKACKGMSGFQSSPIPKDGRYLMNGRTHSVVRCFNPRPSRRMGATSKPTNCHAATRRFQSSPIPKDGRYNLLLM